MGNDTDGFELAAQSSESQGRPVIITSSRLIERYRPAHPAFSQDAPCLFRRRYFGRRTSKRRSVRGSGFHA
jgi:hypothetical protein